MKIVKKKKKKKRENITIGKEISGNRNKNRWNVKYFSTAFYEREYEIRDAYDYMLLKQEINTWTDFSVLLIDLFVVTAKLIFRPSEYTCKFVRCTFHFEVQKYRTKGVI